MPLNNGKHPPVCINHPGEKMAVMKSNKTPSAVHGLMLINQKGGDPTQYEMASEVTGTNIYACKQCGYCEIYLVDAELKQIQAP